MIFFSPYIHATLNQRADQFSNQYLQCNHSGYSFVVILIGTWKSNGIHYGSTTIVQKTRKSHDNKITRGNFKRNASMLFVKATCRMITF